MEEKFYGVGGFLGNDDAENFLAYAEVYKDTVKTLLDHFSKSPQKEPLFFIEDLGDGEYEKKLEEVDSQILPIHAFGVLPIVFLFRHYVELQLKGLVLSKGIKLEKMNHNIQDLLTKLIGVSRTTRVSKDSKDFILDIQKWDESSDGFRYPCDKKGRPFFQGKSESFLERINTLSNLKNIILSVIHDLENIEGDFDAEKDHAESDLY